VAKSPVIQVIVKKKKKVQTTSLWSTILGLHQGWDDPHSNDDQHAKCIVFSRQYDFLQN
jgi:hypothetical protein